MLPAISTDPGLLRKTIGRMRDDAQVLVLQPSHRLLSHRRVLLDVSTLLTALELYEDVAKSLKALAKAASLDQVNELPFSKAGLARAEDARGQDGGQGDDEDEDEAQAAFELRLEEEQVAFELRLEEEEAALNAHTRTYKTACQAVQRKVRQAEQNGDLKLLLALHFVDDLVKCQGFRIASSNASDWVSDDKLKTRIGPTRITPQALNQLDPEDQIFSLLLERRITQTSTNFLAAAVTAAGGLGPQGGTLGITDEERRAMRELGKQKLSPEACLKEILLARERSEAGEDSFEGW